MEHLLGELIADLRYAIRTQRKRPLFTVLAVVSLGLGIGANTTIFSIVNALLLQPLPVREPSQLVAIYTTDTKNPGFNSISHLNWRDYRRDADAFSAVLGYDWTPMSVSTGGEGRLMFGQLVSGDYFDVLGVPALIGRTFRLEEDVTPTPVVVLSHGFWVKELGGDLGVVGRTINVNASPFTVIGVAPESFGGTDVGLRPELWIPMSMNRQIKPNDSINWYEERRGLFVGTIGRLKPGATLTLAQSQATMIAQRLEREFPDDNNGRGLRLIPLAQATINPGARGGFVAATALLMTVVGLVLLIACANVSNLLLARALARQREIAIRLAMGASRARLIRQLLAESLILAFAGAAFGILIAYWARLALLAFLPSLPFPVTIALHLDLDGRVLLFTLLLAIGTGVLFGLVPALQASKPQLLDSLKDREAPSPADRRFGARNLLVVGQVALSLVALVGAGLFLRSLGAAQRTDPGFETEKLLTMTFDLGLQGYDQPRGEQFFRQLLERVGTLPGVAAVSVAQGGPLQGTLARSVFLEGGDPNDRRLVQVNVVGPRYFETLGVPIIRGRGFTEDDREGAPKAVVINETMAKTFWKDADPVGKRFRFFSDSSMSEVVGVARDIKYNNLGEDPQSYIYEPLAQRYMAGMTLMVRTATTPGPLLNPVEREVRALDRDLPIVGRATVSEVLHQALWAPRVGASLLALFGLLALVLSAVGIYGVASYSVSQRRREIGIRMALGASARDVLGMILRQGMGVLAAGLVVGLAMALGITRLASNLLFGISPTDWISFGATSLLLTVVALTANLLPARRAIAVDPTVALRNE
jgi:macrolide transport system ATP-binding/permease protein